MSDAFWNSMVQKHNAVRVKFGLPSRESNRAPRPQDVPDQAIWFETTNFGYILSRVENGTRRVLFRY